MYCLPPFNIRKYHYVYFSFLGSIPIRDHLRSLHDSYTICSHTLKTCFPSILYPRVSFPVLVLVTSDHVGPLKQFALTPYNVNTSSYEQYTVVKHHGQTLLSTQITDDSRLMGRLIVFVGCYFAWIYVIFHNRSYLMNE